MSASVRVRHPVGNVRSVSHIALYVRNLDRSADFYARFLGFEIRLDERDHAGHPRIFGTVAGFMLELMKAKPDAPEWRPAGMGLAGLAFSVSNLDALCEALHAEGYVRLPKPKQIGRLKMIFAQDPDGSFFELVEYPEGARSIAEALAP